MQKIAEQRGEVVSAKEIAEKYGISFELLSKILQKLMKSGLITSQQGVRGGYVLAKIPNFVSIADVIEAIEGKPSLTECGDNNLDEDCGCQVHRCTIRSPLKKIQDRINIAFSSMSIAEMIEQ